jgi:predicted HAD superfamily Cof-like phosphohydrolase
MSNNTTQIANVFTSVIDFNQRVLHVLPRPLGLLNEAETEITAKCLREESDEFEAAIAEGDFIGAVDALVDSIYFAIGGLYKLGLTAESIEQSIFAVHNANMEKKLGVNARRGDGSAADAVKPEGWVGPEERISVILDRQPVVNEV